jgi:hypothetical protein
MERVEESEEMALSSRLYGMGNLNEASDSNLTV